LGNAARALRELGTDQILVEAASEFPAARERLLHIGRLTENATRMVGEKVARTSAVQERLLENNARLLEAWKRALSTETIPDSLRPLAEQTIAVLQETKAGVTSTRAALLDMAKAHDFQDLTGQLIKRVVQVLEQTENELLRLLFED
jgi:chemotaxis protein CheZ